MNARVALATSGKWPRLSPDDAGIAEALAPHSIAGEPVIWSDSSIDWRTFDLVVVRSCWDYHLRVHEFRAWIDGLEREGVRLLNPPHVIRWNMHKRYLLELRGKGVRIPRTELIEDAGDVVVKPAISASAHATQRMRGDIIVQEFVPEIASRGEWSIVFIDGAFSHSVKKLPKEGDFRVQEELGGSSVAMAAPPHVVATAESAMKHVGNDVLYARVDVVERDAGVTLMELELIEPWLFLTTSAGATSRLAAAIAARINR